MTLSSVFSALSDPTRIAIVERLLTEGELTAGEIAEPCAMSKPAVSRHLKVLEEAQLIERRVNRQFRVFRACPEAFGAVEDWIARYRSFWNGSLDRLERHLEERTPKA